jgi:2-oxoglutarate dehydrogenase E2 component (dihydrolipoamide succinyltransferase)
MALLEVKIPAMGESISGGVLAAWHVQEGAAVAKDQPIYELETDKITSEGTAPAAGRISLKVAAGAEVKIGQVVAVIDDAPAKQGHPEPVEGSRPEPVEGQSADPAPAPAPVPTSVPTPKAAPVPAAAAPKVPAPAAQSPVLRQAQDAALRQAQGESGAPAAQPRQTRRKLTPLRQRIAERLVAAQHEAAMLTTFNEVDMSAVMALRARYQEDFVKKYGVKLGFMSFFTKAVVHALREVPAVNSQLDGDMLVQNHYFDIGVAVSTEKGLMVPVVRDCDRMGMADIEKAIAESAKKAREGKIALSDLEGGVFTITNGGIFGSMLSTPIINPPQSAILGLHAITDRPAAVGGQVVIRPMMYLALSYDHRVVDGREAVTFLVKVKQAIEDPARLLLNI